jgi:hypothetical protein
LEEGEDEGKIKKQKLKRKGREILQESVEKMKEKRKREPIDERLVIPCEEIKLKEREQRKSHIEMNDLIQS